MRISKEQSCPFQSSKSALPFSSGKSQRYATRSANVREEGSMTVDRTFDGRLILPLAYLLA